MCLCVFGMFCCGHLSQSLAGPSSEEELGCGQVGVASRNFPPAAPERGRFVVAVGRVDAVAYLSGGVERNLRRWLVVGGSCVVWTRQRRDAVLARQRAQLVERVLRVTQVGRRQRLLARLETGAAGQLSGQQTRAAQRARAFFIAFLRTATRVQRDAAGFFIFARGGR